MDEISLKIKQKKAELNSYFKGMTFYLNDTINWLDHARKDECYYRINRFMPYLTNNLNDLLTKAIIANSELDSLENEADNSISQPKS